MATDAAVERSVSDGSWHVFHREDGLPSDWGIPTATPFLLNPDFRYDRELNEFFYSADMLSARAATRDGYARDLLMFFNFLHRSRDVADWRHATEEDHRAYLVWRRFEPQGPRVVGATWNREVSAQARFFRWQAARGRIAKSPVPQRARRHRPGYSARGPGETAATYAHDATRGNVKWLPAASYRRWRDVGLRGYLPDGLPDPAFRGRWASRNSTFADLMVRTGMRLTEQVSLLTGELPLATDRGYERFRLPGAVAKAGSERWVYVPTSVLREISTYVAFDRGAIVDAARERGGYAKLSGPVLDPRTGRVTVAWPDGLRTHTRADLLTPAQRQHTVIETADGLEPAALWLSEAGRPMAAQTWKDIFRQANARCEAHDVRLRAHPHLLRHTFAVLTLEQLQRGHIDELSGLSPQQRTHYSRVFGDPLDWVRRALGHRSVTTTQVYLHALEELEMETRLALIPSEWEDPRAADFSADQT
ncbi:tyrosine-type recombinase/integrase [Microbacterium sp. OR16]|uniref:tyrosine-type recombinase/integrase n=1 Tax=Microbacterium sp. OR16 TaxID=3095345 RepID=UPI0039B4FCB2